MTVDWEEYRAACRKTAEPAFRRFSDILIKGSRIATRQSAAAYIGFLTAVLVTVCSDLTDNLIMCAHSSDDSAGPRTGKTGQTRDERRGQAREDRRALIEADTRKIRNMVRERYYESMSEIPDMDIAAEYLRTRIRHQEPDTEAMTKWLLSFNGNREGAENLAEKAAEKTEEFVRDIMPEIIESEAVFLK